MRDELHAAWRSFFTAIASTGPLITVVEDIHWAEATFLELIEHIPHRRVRLVGGQIAGDTADEAT